MKFESLVVAGGLNRWGESRRGASQDEKKRNASRNDKDKTSPHFALARNYNSFLHRSGDKSWSSRIVGNDRKVCDVGTRYITNKP